MTVLLTILAIALVVVFLGVLTAGLIAIRKPLESVRGFMERIAMGVRAIEHETMRFEPGLERTHEVTQSGLQRMRQLQRALGKMSEALTSSTRLPGKRN